MGRDASPRSAEGAGGGPGASRGLPSRPRWWPGLGLPAAAAALAALLSFAWGSFAALAASGLGILWGALMCLASGAFIRKARTAEGHAIVTAMMAGLAVSFALLGAGVLAARWLWQEMAAPAALTALAVYLAHRFTAAFAAWPRAGGPGRSGDPQRR